MILLINVLAAVVVAKLLLLLLFLVHGKRRARGLLVQDYREVLLVRVPNVLPKLSAGYLLHFATWGGPPCLTKVDVVVIVAVVVTVVVVLAAMMVVVVANVVLLVLVSGLDYDVVVDTNA